MREREGMRERFEGRREGGSRRGTGVGERERERERETEGGRRKGEGG